MRAVHALTFLLACLSGLAIAAPAHAEAPPPDYTTLKTQLSQFVTDSADILESELDQIPKTEQAVIDQLSTLDESEAMQSCRLGEPVKLNRECQNRGTFGFLHRRRKRQACEALRRKKSACESVSLELSRIRNFESELEGATKKRIGAIQDSLKQLKLSQEDPAIRGLIRDNVELFSSSFGTALGAYQLADSFWDLAASNEALAMCHGARLGQLQSCLLSYWIGQYHSKLQDPSRVDSLKRVQASLFPLIAGTLERIKLLEQYLPTQCYEDESFLDCQARIMANRRPPRRR